MIQFLQFHSYYLLINLYLYLYLLVIDFSLLYILNFPILIHLHNLNVLHNNLLLKNIIFLQIKFPLILITMYIIGIIFYFLFFFIIEKLGQIYSLFCYYIPFSLTNFILFKNNSSIIFLIIFIIVGLIYLEIIEIKIYDLNKDLKYKIIERGKEDIDFMIRNISEISIEK